MQKSTANFYTARKKFTFLKKVFISLFFMRLRRFIKKKGLIFVKFSLFSLFFGR